MVSTALDTGFSPVCAHKLGVYRSQNYVGASCFANPFHKQVSVFWAQGVVVY